MTRAEKVVWCINVGIRRMMHYLTGDARDIFKAVSNGVTQFSDEDWQKITRMQEKTERELGNVPEVNFTHHQISKNIQF